MIRKYLFAIGLIMIATTTENANGNTMDGIITENTNPIKNNIHGFCVNLYCELRNPTTIKSGRPRNTCYVPTIYINNHTLYLNNYPFEEIRLVSTDEYGDDNVIYSSAIPDGAVTIDIPVDITGNFEICLYHGIIASMVM